MNRSPDSSERLNSSGRSKKVLLFGKTGQGKSTTANMLVSGELLPTPKFEMGDGLKGVTETCQAITGRDYLVVDTVGLGEDSTNRTGEGAGVDHAIRQIQNFLVSTQGEYSHILFVKSADRFDQLDKNIFKTFKNLFKGAEPAFGVVVTKCKDPAKWRATNEKTLQEKYGDVIPRGRYVFVDFPPLESDDPELESLMQKKRAKSLKDLDEFLAASFEENKFKYHTPHYVGVSTVELLTIAKNVFIRILEDGWEYVKQFASNPKDFAEKALSFFGPAMAALGVRVTSAIFSSTQSILDMLKTA